MGSVFSSVSSYSNADVPVKKGKKTRALNKGTTYAIVAAIDYSTCQSPWRECQLQVKPSFDYIVSACQGSGIQTQTLWNQQATKQNVLNAIAQVVQKAKKGDTFLFYYTGHGDRLQDQDGDEADGLDEALCLVGPNGHAEPRDQVWLRDDDFADAVTRLRKGVDIILIADCCHSGTIADLHKPQWEGYNVASLAGARDVQTGLADASGGIFTQCMRKACEESGANTMGVGQIYNSMRRHYNNDPVHKGAGHTQDFHFDGRGDWQDLQIPFSGYTRGSGGSVAVPSGGIQQAYQPAAVAQPQVNVQQQLIQQLQQAGLYQQAASPVYQQAASPVYQQAASPVYQQAAYQAYQPQQVYGGYGQQVRYAGSPGVQYRYA